MPKISNLTSRFEVDLTVIEGGMGTIRGLIAEPDQNTNRAYVFTTPRQLLRVKFPTAVTSGLVLRTPTGEVFITADNGPSEMPQGAAFQSFKLFRATGQYTWERRIKTLNPITGLEQDSGHQSMGTIWATLEPSNREGVERNLHVKIEQANFMSGSNVKRDDLLDGRPVVTSFDQLGLKIGTLS